MECWSRPLAVFSIACDVNQLVLALQQAYWGHVTGTLLLWRKRGDWFRVHAYMISCRVNLTVFSCGLPNAECANCDLLTACSVSNVVVICYRIITTLRAAKFQTFAWFCAWRNCACCGTYWRTLVQHVIWLWHMVCNQSYGTCVLLLLLWQSLWVGMLKVHWASILYEQSMCLVKIRW